MAAGGASKSTTNETEKEAEPNVKEKLYSGVMYESVDDDKFNKSKYHHWKQKYVGDQIREPQPLPASKRPKVAEVPSASSLSTALGYLISPVKYIASAFTYSASETDKPLEKPKGKNSSKPKEPSPRQLVLSKQTAAVNSTITAQNVPDTPQKILEAPVKALKTIPLSEITAANSMMSAKSRGGTPTLKSKDKKTALKQKPGNSKKVHEIKKSQSQQIKGSPKVFKNYSPPRNADALPVVSSTKMLSVNEMKIVQSNRAAFRVVSREDTNTDADVHTYRFEGNPALASRSNNSNVIWELSPLMSPLRDELSFADDPSFAYPVQNCSNSSPYNWNLADSSRHKHAFHPDFTRRPPGSPLVDLPTASSVAEVLDISCDREAIETIFSDNLLTPCTPTQLLAGDKSQSGALLLQESFNMDSADLRETLLANDNTRPSTSPLNKWQPVKDFERDPNYNIAATGPSLKKSPPLQSPKTSSKTKAKSQKTPKAKPPSWSKRKMPKEDSDPSSSRTKSAFLSNGFKSSSPRPSSLPGTSLKRTDVIVDAAPKRKEEINKEEMKKTSPATAALNTTTIATATTAVSEAVIKAATSKVQPAEATPVAKTEEKSVRETSPTATMRATERSASSDNEQTWLLHDEETWLLHAIRSLSPTRKDPPHNFTSDTQPPAPSTPPPQPSAPIPPGPKMTPGTASISSKSVTITSAAPAPAEAITGGAQSGASLAMRGALKFTSVVKEAMKKSHSVNILGKKQLSSLTLRGEYDQEKDDFPKPFSVSATLYGEFP